MGLDKGRRSRNVSPYLEVVASGQLQVRRRDQSDSVSVVHNGVPRHHSTEDRGTGEHGVDYRHKGGLVYSSRSGRQVVLAEVSDSCVGARRCLCSAYFCSIRLACLVQAPGCDHVVECHLGKSSGLVDFDCLVVKAVDN